MQRHGGVVQVRLAPAVQGRVPEEVLEVLQGCLDVDAWRGGAEPLSLGGLERLLERAICELSDDAGAGSAGEGPSTDSEDSDSEDSDSDSDDSDSDSEDSDTDEEDSSDADCDEEGEAGAEGEEGRPADMGRGGDGPPGAAGSGMTSGISEAGAQQRALGSLLAVL